MASDTTAWMIRFTLPDLGGFDSAGTSIGPTLPESRRRRFHPGWHHEAMGTPLTGRLLVAAPRLVDPNFLRTVVLVCRHDEDGALGLVLNRLTSVTVGEALPGWVEPLAPPNVVFLGGPVQPEMAVGLGRLRPEHAGRAESDQWTPIDQRLGLVDLSGSPAAEVGALDRLRVFAGYAGWSAGQLDLEVASVDWFVLPTEDEDPFTAGPGGLWRRVLRRQRGPVALFADFPPDPSLN
ncbi:MAG TPA: YqgE/AlgH family protein [Acidimicrobiia bacterium]|nr:YqgE/AlgH family protein [Acidimicrobiia bacterium]